MFRLDSHNKDVLIAASSARFPLASTTITSSKSLELARAKEYLSQAESLARGLKEQLASLQGMAAGL